MPKKSVAARSGAQRQKPRAQKSFELVRPEVEERDDEIQLGTVPAARSEATELVTPKPQDNRQSARTAKSVSAVASEPIVENESESVLATVPKASNSTRLAAKSTSTAAAKPETKSESVLTTVPKASASTRMATRRQGTQRAQQRSSATLISAEHFAYVRRDLVIIATLAILMFAAIIVLYFVFGRGA